MVESTITTDLIDGFATTMVVNASTISTTLESEFLGVTSSAWFTMLGLVGVVILSLLIVIVLGCICCVVDDPQKVQTKNLRQTTRTVVVPVQNERTIEKRDVLIQMPSVEQKLISHSKHQNNQHSKQIPRRDFRQTTRQSSQNVYPVGFEKTHQTKSQRDKNSYKNSDETSPSASLFNPRQSPYHGF